MSDERAIVKKRGGVSARKSVEYVSNTYSASILVIDLKEIAKPFLFMHKLFFIGKNPV